MYRDPYLFDKHPSHKEAVKFFNIEFEADEVILFANINGHSFIKFAQLQRLERWKKTILHSYHLKLLQIRERISSILEGMMQGRKRARTHWKVGSYNLSETRWIDAKLGEFGRPDWT